MKKLLGFTIIISLALTFSACAPKETENKPVTTEKAVTTEETKEATPEADSRVLANYKEFQTQDSATITWFEQGWTGLDADKDFVTPEIAALTN